MAAEARKDLMAGVYRSYDDGDPQPLIDLFADDGIIRFVAPAEVFPFAAPRRGPSGVREALALIGADYEWLSYRNLEMIVDGDWFFALNGGRVRHRASDREAVIHLADLVRFQGEQVAEYVEFFDSARVQDWSSGTCLPASTQFNPSNRATGSAVGDAERNKAALTELFAAYRKKDAGPMIALLADDVSYNSVASPKDFPFAGPCFGRDAFVENLALIAEHYELEKYDTLGMVAEGDLVAVHSDAAFRHRAAGKLASVEKIDLFRLRDGKIVEFNEFFDTLTARAASVPD